MENKTTKTNSLKMILPYIGAIFITLGYIKVSVYYSYFGIKINNFIELSEILTYFMPDLIQTLGLFVFILIFSILIYENSSNSKKDKQKELHNANTLCKRFWLYFKQNLFLSITSVSLILIFFVTYFFFSVEYYSILSGPIFWPLFWVGRFFIIEIKRKLNSFPDSNISYLINSISILAIIVMFSMSSAYYEIEYTKRMKPLVEFTYDKERIKTDNQNLYLGQTKNYLFIRNECKNENFIYERKKITHFIQHY